MKKTLLFSCALLFSTMAFAQTYKNVYSAKQDWSNVFDYNKMENVMSARNGMALDDSGFVYLSGSSTNDSTGYTAGFYIKYSPDGKLVWNNPGAYFTTECNAILWDSIQHRLYGSAINIENAGGVGLTGEFALNMFTTGGSQIGVFIYPDVGPKSRLPHYAGSQNICEDKTGKVYATGYMSGFLYANSLNHIRLTISKVDGANTLWISTYDSTNLMEEEGEFIALDQLNNVYVCGVRGDSLKNNTNQSLLCVKYDSAGNMQWQRKYQNLDTFHLTHSTGLAVSNSGSAYMCGNIPNPGSYHNDGIILKYTNQGKFAWQRRMSSLMLHVQNAGCNGLVLDKSGNLLIAGNIETDSGEYAALVKLDSNGNILWQDTLHDPAPNGALVSNAIALTLDDTGNVYITGTRGDNQTFQDVFTARYSAAGEKQWYIRYNDSTLSFNSPTAITLDKQGNVIVAGGHNGDTITGEDLLVLKYSQYMTKVRVHTSAINTSLPQGSGISIFPNPFTDHINCELNLSTPSSVGLAFYDLTGRELKTLEYSNLPAGQNNFEAGLGELAKGLYFYKCTIVNLNGAVTQNGKLEKE